MLASVFIFEDKVGKPNGRILFLYRNFKIGRLFINNGEKVVIMYSLFSALFSRQFVENNFFCKYNENNLLLCRKILVIPCISFISCKICFLRVAFFSCNAIARQQGNSIFHAFHATFCNIKLKVWVKRKSVNHVNKLHTKKTSSWWPISFVDRSKTQSVTIRMNDNERIFPNFLIKLNDDELIKNIIND